MKKMRFIHCLLLVVLLGITAAGTMLILGAVPEEMLSFENPVQLQQPEAATAFDTIGTALYGLREKARLLQTLQAEAAEDRPELLARSQVDCE